VWGLEFNLQYHQEKKKKERKEKGISLKKRHFSFLIKNFKYNT
jgi:hypothetical protein